MLSVRNGVVAAVLLVLTVSLLGAADPAPADPAPADPAAAARVTVRPALEGDRVDPVDRAARAGTVRITDDVIPSIPRVPRTIIGANQRWIDDADGALIARGPRPRLRDRVVELARRLRLGSVRYAGGTVANLFDYRASSGKPTCQTSGGFVNSSPAFSALPASRSRYTIQRHAEFLRRTGATTNLLVPMINTTPAQAAAYVKAVTDLTGQRVVNVEIGNEPYLPDQQYWRAESSSKRLSQYIGGGTEAQTAERNADDSGATGLFPLRGCDLLHPVQGNGRKDQTYRTRYVGVATDPEPVVTVNNNRWQYVPRLSTAHRGDRVFTVSSDGNRIKFGNGATGAIPPDKASMRIYYTPQRQPGYVQMREALKKVKGVKVNVCASWGKQEFVVEMNRRGLPYDCVAVHSYSNFNLADNKPRTAPKTYEFLMGEGTRLTEELEDLRRRMRSAGSPQARGRFLMVTEFGTIKTTFQGQNIKFLNDMFLARLLMGQIRNGVRTSTISNFAATFTVPHGKSTIYTLTDRAYVQLLFRQFVGHRVVRVAAPRAEGIDLMASRHKRVSNLMVFNRRRTAGWDPRIAVPGTGPTCVEIRAMSDDLGARSLPMRAGRAPRAAYTRMIAARGGDVVSPGFPRHSVSVLTFRPRSGGGCGQVQYADAPPLLRAGE